MEIILPPGWPRPKGYSNGVTAKGQLLFISGQIGWTPDERFEAKDFLGQTRQALINIMTILRTAGGQPLDLVRMTWFVLDKQEYLAASSDLGRVYREVIGTNYPAMTLVEVAGLLETGARVEIEATAVISTEA